MYYTFTEVDNKTITRKIRNESISFSERIQGDICGPIHPPCTSTTWSHIWLLSTRNQVFVKLLVQLKAHFPDYPIKKICFDNTGEITSHAFHGYCISIGIEVEHPVAYVHTQNRLAESLLKRQKLVARPLLMRVNLLMAT